MCTHFFFSLDSSLKWLIQRRDRITVAADLLGSWRPDPRQSWPLWWRGCQPRHLNTTTTNITKGRSVVLDPYSLNSDPSKKTESGSGSKLFPNTARNKYNFFFMQIRQKKSLKDISFHWLIRFLNQMFKQNVR